MLLENKGNTSMYSETWSSLFIFIDSKVHGANMGPIWGRQDPGGPHVDPMNFAIWVSLPSAITLSHYLNHS